MTRFSAATILVVLLVASCDGAALMRFINLVPQRTYHQVSSTARNSGQNPEGGVWSYDSTVDRVGLQYYPSQSTKQVVWTEELIVGMTATTSSGAGTPTPTTAPFAYSHAMPPLRSAHAFNTGATVDTDRVATYLQSQHPAADIAGAPSRNDLNEQSSLKDDGISGYIEFAAGTYTMSAYGVVGSTSINSLSRFDFATTSLTFADNAVYTVVAVGDAGFSLTPAGSSPSVVQLVLIQESTDPTTFGMASIRFFNGFQKFSPDTISVAVGTNTLASGIAYGTVSPYTNFAANKNVHFSLSRSTTPNVDEIDPSLQTDVRAGLRATFFCGINNLQQAAAFCRMIPSRVVAYVRLVHDAAASQNLIQGAFGPQKLGQTNLNLWASFEYPRPEQVVAWSQDTGEVISTGHPLTTRGLYPVVINVAPNTVSGYGEVFVPLFIMDFAIRYYVAQPAYAYNDVATGHDPSMNNNRNRLVGTSGSGLSSYLFSPVFKRVSFVVKTDGFATVQGAVSTTGINTGTIAGVTFAGTNPSGTTTQFGTGNDHIGYFTPGTNDLTNAILTDMYLEPGELYTIAATYINRPTAVPKLQSSGMVVYSIRKDMSVDDVSNSLNIASGAVTFIAFTGAVVAGNGVAADAQAFGPIKIAVAGSTGASQSRDFGNTAVDLYSATLNTIFGSAGWPATVQALPLAAGSYAYSTDTTPAGTACTKTLTPGSFTIVPGQRLDIFILNTRGCLDNNNALGSLVTYQTPVQSAMASGNSAMTTTASRRAAVTERHAVPFFTGAASATATSMSMLFAAVVAALALLFI